MTQHFQHEAHTVNELKLHIMCQLNRHQGILKNANEADFSLVQNGKLHVTLMNAFYSICLIFMFTLCKAM